MGDRDFKEAEETCEICVPLDIAEWIKNDDRALEVIRAFMKTWKDIG